MAFRKEQQSTEQSRRQFLKSAVVTGTAVGFGLPTIVPSKVFGADAPSNLIQVAQIGCGRIARDSEIKSICSSRSMKLARFVAVCDLDSVRMQDARDLIASHYTKAGVALPEVKGYADYQEILADKSIDAVCISTPDHWHAQPAIEAALAGKAIYLQKPASLTIVEGRQMADTVKQCGVVFQQGSQQRSDVSFRKAAELIRNGAIGKIKEIYVGLPVDPSGGKKDEMPVPKNLNYDMWLGETPQVYYTVDRVHPQTPTIQGRYARPGWLRCEQFGAGMITGWGVHHFDIANWAMDWGSTGPLEVEAKAEFPAPESGLWDVHGSYEITATFPGGVIMHVSDKLPNGLKFVGESGQWIFVSRGAVKVTASDPTSPGATLKALDASDPKLLDYKFKDGDVRLHASPENDHHLDWLMAVRAKDKPVASAEDGHRACSTSLVCHTAMKLGKKITWDPKKERFGQEEANAMLTRPQRAPYGTDAVLKKTGIKI